MKFLGVDDQGNGSHGRFRWECVRMGLHFEKIHLTAMWGMDCRGQTEHRGAHQKAVWSV